jgi:hypothetical protein
VKRLAIVMLLGFAGVAEAHGHACQEVSKVMGYSSCRRFGTWSIPFSMFTEVGASMLKYDVDGINAAMRSAGVAPSPVSATLGTWRTAVSIAWFYAGDELGIGSVTGGPRLISGTMPVNQSFAVVQPAESSGFVIQDAVLLGARAHVGPLSIGGEMAIGFRIGDYQSPSLPAPLYDTTEASFLLEARAKADLWVNTWLTVGAMASVSMLDVHNVGVGLTLGFHMMPYDSQR